LVVGVDTTGGGSNKQGYGRTLRGGILVGRKRKREAHIL